MGVIVATGLLEQFGLHTGRGADSFFLATEFSFWLLDFFLLGKSYKTKPNGCEIIRSYKRNRRGVPKQKKKESERLGTALPPTGLGYGLGLTASSAPRMWIGRSSGHFKSSSWRAA